MKLKPNNSGQQLVESSRTSEKVETTVSKNNKFTDKEGNGWDDHIPKRKFQVLIKIRFLTHYFKLFLFLIKYNKNIFFLSHPQFVFSINQSQRNVRN